MTLRKKILFYSILTILTLAALEGMARLAYYLAFAEGYLPPSPTLSAAPTDPTPDESDGLTRRIPPTREEYEFLDQMSHPYYGFTPFSPAHPLNVMPPPQTGTDTILIGILGGSVAWDVTPYFQQALTRYFKDQGLPKEPVIVPMAYGGIKQPQQLHIASFMLAMGGNFDLLVNLDGYNELSNSHLKFTRNVFPFFPAQWENMVFLTQDQIALAGQIRATRAQLAQLQQTTAASPLRHTALYGILYRYQIQQSESRILQLNHDLANQDSARTLERHGPPIPFLNIAQLHQEAVRVWYRSSVLLSRLAAAAGADYYHFLQPNQYIPNSKPLSPKEQRERYILNAIPRTDYPNTYPLFQQFGQDLQRQGVHYFDLAQIFNDRPETLYRDVCCHLNQRGNELLAAAMVQRLAPALQRRAATPNPEPAGSLTVAAPLLSPPAPSAPPPTPAAAPAKEPDFQVSLRPGNLLIYVKTKCRNAHTVAPFFLHITPANPADLPPDRQRYGFAAWDFFVNDADVVDSRVGQYVGTLCIVERRLPQYPIAHLRTGQFNPAGEIWSTELTLSP